MTCAFAVAGLAGAFAGSCGRRGWLGAGVRGAGLCARGAAGASQAAEASYTEQKVLKFLQREYRGEVRFGARFDWCRSPKSGAMYEFDFHLPLFGALVEVDGGQHFRSIRGWMPHDERRAIDVRKMHVAFGKGYVVVHVSQPEIAADSMPWEELLTEAVEDARGSDASFIALDPARYDPHIAAVIAAEGGGEVARDGLRQVYFRPPGSRLVAIEPDPERRQADRRARRARRARRDVGGARGLA